MLKESQCLLLSFCTIASSLLWSLISCSTGETLFFFSEVSEGSVFSYEKFAYEKETVAHDSHLAEHRGFQWQHFPSRKRFLQFPSRHFTEEGHVLCPAVLLYWPFKKVHQVEMHLSLGRQWGYESLVGPLLPLQSLRCLLQDMAGMPPASLARLERRLGNPGSSVWTFSLTRASRSKHCGL